MVLEVNVIKVRKKLSPYGCYAEEGTNAVIHYKVNGILSGHMTSGMVEDTDGELSKRRGLRLLGLPLYSLVPQALKLGDQTSKKDARASKKPRIDI